MKTLHILLVTAALALAAIVFVNPFVPPAHAQVPTDASVRFATWTCTTNAATNVASVIDVGKQASVGLAVRVIPTAAITNHVVAFITRSVDGTYYDVNGTNVTFTATAAAGEATTSLVYLHSLGARYLKINYFTNTSVTGARITNGFAAYAIKISAP